MIETPDNMEPLRSADEALGRIGQPLGVSSWVTVTQDLVTAFAKLTGDEQWIHVDPERAKSGPFGGCVAQGHLTLSLAGGRFAHEIVKTSARMGVNYGSDKVRYPAPVRVGARIRGRAHLVAASKIEDAAVQVTIRMAVEIENEARPGCVADIVARYYF
jgi:acyl dehydratase